MRDFTTEDFPVELPPSLQVALKPIPPDQHKEALESCSHDPVYLEAMQSMENIVATVSAKDPIVLNTMHTLNNSLLFILEKSVENQIKSKFKDLPPHLLQEKVNQQVDTLLVKYYGDCMGNLSTPGCVGQNAKTIRASFSVGNLRERSFLMLDAADKILKEQVFACEEGGFCFCNDLSKDKTDWHEFKAMKPALKEYCSKEQQATLFKRGRFAGTNSFFREKRSEEEKKEVIHLQDFQYKFGTETIPFSSREKTFIDQHGKISDIGNVKLSSGMTLFKPKKLDPSHSPDPHNLYYSTAEKFGFPIKVAPSGTTDSLLNFSCLFGMNQKFEMEAVRAAAIANMVISHHHTAYEIMIASKSFQGLNINPDFEYYQNLFPSNPKFAKKVEIEYMKHHRDLGLPKSIYLRCIQNIVKQNTTRVNPKCSPKNPNASEPVQDLLRDMHPAIKAF